MKKSWALLPVAALWLALAVWCWLRPSDAVSRSERRELAQFPTLSTRTLTDGSFMEDFESYTLDQFPLRDAFRSLKARVHYDLLRQKDNNGIYLMENQAAKLEYPLNEASVAYAAQVLRTAREKYFPNSRVYAAVIPDKGYYLAEPNGYPAMDYEKLAQIFRDGLPFANYVNLSDALTAADYYSTDTHWRQEQLIPVAQKLCEAMGVAGPEGEHFRVKTLEQPFYGVYYGQAALPMEPDVLKYLESTRLSRCRVYHFETDSYKAVYDLSKAEGDDLYEVFLSGSVSLLTMENPEAQTDRELVVFRDSFGSSIAPLLLQGYRKITLVDIRYISSAMLDRFLDFHGQDVLFLYSTLVLNNSQQLR